MHKRIFALVIALCLVSSMGVSAKEFKSIPQTVENASSETKSYDEAIEVLTSLELINRADDKEYNANDVMSRGEFVNILSRMLVLNDSISLDDQTVPFLDVDDNTLYVSSIIYAYKMGIISGGYDGRFNPNQSIKFEEALKMLVTTLGYNLRAEKKGGYPTGYLLFASEKGITKGVDAAVGQEINKGIVAQLILNTLDVNVMQLESLIENDEQYVEIDGETLLSENLRVEKREGIVRATEITRLTSPNGLEYGFVEIDKKLYKTGKTNVWDLLGYNVTYYSRDIDGVSELLFVTKNSKNSVITVEADAIADDDARFTKRRFVYRDENNKKRSISISPYAYVIYNGKALTDYKVADITPSAGEVTFIDNDKDKMMDVVQVMKYSNLVVGNISDSGKCIYDKDDSTKYVPLDPESEEYDFCLTKSGENIDVNKIMKGNVVSYGVSKNATGRKFYYARVSDATVSGSVTAKFTEQDDRYLSIDERDYKLADDFRSEFDNIKLSDRGTFYLDIYGKLSGFEEAASDSELYGFLLSYGCYRKGGKMVNEFEIFTIDGIIEIIETADRFYLDGKLIKVKDLAPSDPQNPNEVEQRLMPLVDQSINTVDTATGGDTTVDPASYARTKLYNQVVRIRFNYDGMIDKIDTRYLNAEKEDDDSLSRDILKENSANARLYNRQQYAFGLDKVDFMIDENTLFMAVPDISKRNEATNYYVSTAFEYFWGNNSYKVEAYDVSDNMVAGLLVMYGDARDIGISGNTGITLVEKVVMADIGEGDFVAKLIGTNKSGQIERYAVTDPGVNAALSALKKGDIIRIGENSLGDIVKVQKLISPTDGPKMVEDGGSLGRFYSGFRFVYGMLCKRVKDTITVSRDVNDTTNPASYSDKVDYYNVNGFEVWIYKHQDKTFTKGTIKDVNDYIYQNNPNARIAIHTDGGNAGTIVLVDLG